MHGIAEIDECAVVHLDTYTSTVLTLGVLKSFDDESFVEKVGAHRFALEDIEIHSEYLLMSSFSTEMMSSDIVGACMSCSLRRVQIQRR